MPPPAALLNEITSLALALPVPQAGGGGSFGGGGGGGGFGGGGGDGIGAILWFLIRFAIEVPILGVPLLIGVVFVMVTGSKRGWWKHQERAIRRTRPQRYQQVSAVSARSLQQDDPAFDEAAFLGRVKQAFLVAQRSWCAQDLEPLRAFVSDGVFERFSLQIEEQKRDGWKQGMLGTEILGLMLVHVETGLHFDTVTVRIPFRSSIHRLSLDTGQKIGGSELPKNSFAECWSFVRRRGAKTLTGEGLLEGKCPNCAAPLTLRQSAKCEHCDCLARSGQFDWILAEITQASEWRPEQESSVKGLSSYAEGDPGISAQLLEDRASVAFWRKCAADSSGGIEPLTRLATPEFCERYGAQLAVPSGSDRPRVYTGDCAVGSVRTLGILPGPKRDRAIVEVVWDGRRARHILDGIRDGTRELEKYRMLRRTLFVFERKSGEKSALEDTFTTAHCKNCGTHDPGGTQPNCAYCGAARTGDDSVWLLGGVATKGTGEAQGLLAELSLIQLSSQPAAKVAGAPAAELVRGQSAEDMLVWASALVHADGEVTLAERKAVESLAKRAKVSLLRVDLLLSTRPGDEGVPEPSGAAEALVWLQALTKLALADGSLSRAEKKFLREAAQRLGLSRQDIARSITTARTALYRESRRARRP